MSISQKNIQESTERIFSRSSGPGGQHVNKTSSKVQLTFDIMQSPLTDAQKQRLLRSFPNGFIRVLNQDTRHQSRNSQIAFEKLSQLIHQALTPQKKRTKTLAPHLKPSGKKKKLRQDKLMKYKNRHLSD